MIFYHTSCSFSSKNIKIQCNNLFLVYMAGDNSLNKTVYSDFEEIKEGLRTEDDIILILADRYSSNFYEDEWNETRLFQISYENNELKVIELQDENMGLSLEWLDDNIDTGCETTLKSFLEYAHSHYDSKKLYLDLWNHGGGWKSGDTYTGLKQVASRNICLDEYENNSLSLKELSSAIKNSEIEHFDIILMDACSMASIEVAAELLGFTDTVIFSQDTIPEDGMPYDKIVPVLLSDKTSDEKCSQICDLYTQSYEKQKTTISAIRIDENNCMKKFLDEFEEFVKNLTDLKKIRQELPYYYNFLSEVVDFSIFCDDCIETEYNSTVIQNSSDYSTGMSIYFPEFLSYSKDSWEYTPERLKFLKFCPSYIDFLTKIQKENSSDTITDSYEPNNFQIDSYTVNLSENKIISYLWCMNDEDWYVFNTGEIKYIKLIEPEFFDYNFLVLLYKNGNLIESLCESTANKVDITTYDFDKIYVKIYSTFGYSNQELSYSLEWN